MTEQEYYDAVKALGLIGTRFPGTFFTVNNEPHSVPLARDLTPEAREENLERLKRALGKAD